MIGSVIGIQSLITIQILTLYERQTNESIKIGNKVIICCNFLLIFAYFYTVLLHIYQLNPQCL